ncbi:MAG: transketolase C-terminal domain-containing protein [Actinomycetota bacterium]|nr:transketolase C-terminal domain-containing protein [Actinomycetota bacterium]
MDKINSDNLKITNIDTYDDARKILAEALVKLGKNNKDVVYVSLDSSAGAFGSSFKKIFPERHFEFGIAEQNGMGEAAGMAISGKIPIIAAYVPFVSYRPFEQIRDDVCKTKLNVIIIGNNSGFSVSALGPTHTVLEEVGVLRSLPNMTIICPADGVEYEQVLEVASKIKCPTYIRVTRIKSKRIFDNDHKLIFGKADVLREGVDVTLIATGTMVSRSLEAACELEKKNINAEVISMSTIKPLDEKAIIKSAAKTGKVVSVEEHSIYNGLGSAIAEVLVKNCPAKMKFIGTADEYAPVGTYDELMDFYNLTPQKIAAQVMEFYNNF